MGGHSNLGKWVFLGPILLCSSTGYTQDSVTSACRQNPAYCALLTGKEAGVPAVKGAAEVASIAAVLRLLPADIKTEVDHALRHCAEWADAQVNARRFGGNKPSREQCREELSGRDPCGKKVTRAMQWGTEKHQLALHCAQEHLERLMPGRFSLEQRYRYSERTGRRELVSRDEAQQLLARDCGEELTGTLVPDVVIHTGNPLEPLAVYDFKFPCPSLNMPQWNRYPKGHPHHPKNQGEMYQQALGKPAQWVAPTWGIQ